MRFLKRGVLFFWAAWFSVVAATNVLDALRTLGLMPMSFAFVSGNWAWINRVMDPLAVPRWLQGALFLGAMSWEALGALLYWTALARYQGRPLAQEPAALRASVVSLALWAAFQVLDEVFLAYPTEDVHRSLFVSQIATILLLQLLPAPPVDGDGDDDDAQRPRPDAPEGHLVIPRWTSPGAAREDTSPPGRRS